LQASLAFLKFLSEDLDILSQGEKSSRISKEIENMISQLADKEKAIQYKRTTKLRVELMLPAKDIGINASMNG
jgi:hypothetical protein